MDDLEEKFTPIRFTGRHIASMPGLAIIFIVTLSVLNNLPMLFYFGGKFLSPPTTWLVWINIAVGLIMTLFVHPFVNAGYYGLLFCRVNDAECPCYFLYLARKNFKQFFLINLFFLGLKFLFEILPSTFIPLLFHQSDQFHQSFQIFGYTSRGIEFIIAFLFLFAYPLAILGYFSHQKLRPITVSMKLFISNFGKILPLVFLLLIQHTYSLALNFLHKSHYNAILISIISSIVDFIIIVMSFVYLTRLILPDLQYDFSSGVESSQAS